MSVLDVADWFLTLAEAEEKQLEHMQLQRLCCYAQGFALAPQEPPWALANCRVDKSPFGWSTMHEFLRSELEAADREADVPEADIDWVLRQLATDDELRAQLRRGRADIAAGRVRRHVRL